jgi:hypothetical protein
LTFSDGTKVRLDPSDNQLKLKLDANGDFPTDDDLFISTGLFYPTTGRAWTGFQALTTEPTDTSLGFKLNDDTDDYYWDGGAWSVAGLSDWSTEADIATNIATFPSRKLRVVINLKTTDDTVSPSVASVLIGFRARIVFFEQWIYRTLVPLLRDSIRPLADWPFPKGATGTTIDLNDFELDAAFNLVDVEAAFNHTDDPDHLTDIFSGYDTGTKVITLTTSVDAGKVVWIEFAYEPEVAVFTSVDYKELAKTPAITVENLRVGKAIRHGLTNELVNKGDVTKALKYEPPWQCSLLGDIVIHAPRSVDELALSEEVIAYISENQTITVQGTDEKVDLFLLGNSFLGRDSSANVKDLRIARFSFEMRWLKAWLRPVRDSTDGIYSVNNFELALNAGT